MLMNEQLNSTAATNRKQVTCTGTWWRDLTQETQNFAVQSTTTMK